MLEIVPKRVHEIFNLVSWNPSRDGSNFVQLEAILALTTDGQPAIVRFHPQRLRRYAHEVDELVDNLPIAFSQISGAPLSEACHDKTGKSWTSAGDACAIEQLVLLGCAVGRIALVQQRELWGNDVAPPDPLITISTAH